MFSIECTPSTSRCPQFVQVASEVCARTRINRGIALNSFTQMNIEFGTELATHL